MTLELETLKSLCCFPGYRIKYEEYLLFQLRVPDEQNDEQHEIYTYKTIHYDLSKKTIVLNIEMKYEICLYSYKAT